MLRWDMRSDRHSIWFVFPLTEDELRSCLYIGYKDFFEMSFAFNDDASLCRICSDPDVFDISWRIFKNVNFFLLGHLLAMTICLMILSKREFKNSTLKKLVVIFVCKDALPSSSVRKT